MSGLLEALARGDPQDVSRLIASGHDIRYRREHGYTALLDAVHGRDVSRDPALLELLTLLVRHGADLNAISTYQESGLRRLSHVGRFDAVKVLLDAGADPTQLAWTPLMAAVALGSAGDVSRELGAPHDLEARDWWQRTAFHLALITGEMEKIEMLFERGADADALGRIGPPLFYAIDGHRAQAAQWLLDVGADVNQIDHTGVTALMHAIEQDDADCARVLIDAGADVARDVFGTALDRARTRECVELLLGAGADPAKMSGEARRALVGLPPDPDAQLLTAPPDEFRRAPTRRFGVRNPEPIDEPFWIAMIRAGVPAYSAGMKYAAPLTCPRLPIWSAHRFGQSVTRLPDGRFVQVGGEHEDFYDADFCIYNDVFVHAPDGSIAIFAYPEEVFSPTDFHTATLIGDTLYLVGGLGYQGKRRYGTTPVYRLDLETFAIERLATSGPAPGWIYGHRAESREASVLRVWGGTVVTAGETSERHDPNGATFLLDLESGVWRLE